MDSSPPARRPHKSPAHTVKDLRNRPQRRIPPLRTKVPERAAHHTALSMDVNTLEMVFSGFVALRAGRHADPGKGRALCRTRHRLGSPPRLTRHPALPKVRNPAWSQNDAQVRLDRPVGPVAVA